MTDARTEGTTADDTAAPDAATRPEHRPATPAAAIAGTPLPIALLGADPTQSDPEDAGAWMLAGGAGPQTPKSATLPVPDPDSPVAGVAYKTAMAKTGPYSFADPRSSSAPDLRDVLSGLDPLRDGFGDPAHLAALGTSPTPLQAGPAAAPVPVAQLAAQVTAALTRGTNGETELALSPAELGHVRVKLKPDAANPDRLVVMITFERSETLELFRRHSGDLADAFRAAGYAGADLGFGQQGSGQPDPRDHTTARHFDDIPQSDPDGDLHPSPRHSGAASLDLRL